MRRGLLPGGNASHSDRTFHRVLQSQVQFMCGYDCVFMLTGDANELAVPSRSTSARAVFDRALANLKKADAVGVLKKLDDLVPQLQHHLGFVPADVQKFPFENSKKGKRSRLSNESRALLEEWLRDEIYMYNYASKLSDAKTQHAKDCLKQVRKGR